MPVLAPSPENIAVAARALAEGKLVAFPTETVYGLGADATNGEAIARLYAAKGRPRFNPLIVHVADIGLADQHGELTPLAAQLAAALWPGPLTLVVRRRPGSPISDLATAGLDTVALRIPDHPIAQAVLRTSGLPLAAPSANRSGHVSATTAQHVIEDLDTSVAIVLDGGPTAHGIESTILDVTGPTAILLRPGAIQTSIIEAVLGTAIARSSQDTALPTAPGQLSSHYAPRAALRLNAAAPLPGEALLAFGPAALPQGVAAINLSPSGDLIEAAANLFTALRRLDASGAHTIAVMPIPEQELGEAINDRLRRAAAPRP
jgi:L-threonylcarbamoyladenylate synthase